ncbi:hypothetical protein [Herbiconiux liukaitaii]|uniref:hypothetical protein n=1 Tax=Herbiconiux liukaitaii TaxID=3342799 RepID=UPI0035B72995
MPDTVTAYGAVKFGSRGARPRIVGVYAGAGGWREVSGSRLTRGTAEELRAEGITMVRVRWHFRTHEILLRRYLGT